MARYTLCKWALISSMLFAAAAGQTLAGGQTEFYFPFYQGHGFAFTGFALSNFSNRPASLQLTAYAPAGAKLPLTNNPARLQLPPRTQTVRLGHEIFGAHPASQQNGWIEVLSDNPEIATAFQFGH